MIDQNQIGSARSIRIPGWTEPVRVGKLVCIGRNYAKHAAEMGGEIPAEPMIFLKPASALLTTGGSVELPSRSVDVHHEVELVVVIGKAGRDIGEAGALSHVAGYAVGLDITARDLQLAAKRAGEPWAVAKGFDTFAPVGPVVEPTGVDPGNLEIRLRVNGETRQHASTRDLIFSVERLIAYCSTIFCLDPGDLIFTGTPEGVGPINAGDRLEATIGDWPALEVTAVKRS